MRMQLPNGEWMDAWAPYLMPYFTASDSAWCNSIGIVVRRDHLPR